MKRAKRIYLTIIIACLAIISVSVYYSLGGFEEVKVFVLEGNERTVIGREFVGKHNSQVFDSLMLETFEGIELGKLNGALTIVYYPDAFEDRDSIKCFIGASIDEVKDIVSLPPKYDYREFKTDQIYKIFLSQHPLVRPSPSEIASLMEVRAIEEGDVLQPFNFELYYKDADATLGMTVRLESQI